MKISFRRSNVPASSYAETGYMYNFPLIRAAMLPFMGTSRAGLVTTRKIAYNIEALQRGMDEVQGEEQIPFGKPILY